ncbi:hypothetical protein NDU88_001858 [Pleurodeles waltl]|uniref:Uncharacterized protein n=1 Tax=Pleurodeles waltl TaxID=8319 RepID=A0AAV7L1R5_PLEWA|nr:hypothetical protein NDU88_001858 [Pleurodeles waltl]
MDANRSFSRQKDIMECLIGGTHRAATNTLFPLLETVPCRSPSCSESWDGLVKQVDPCELRGKLGHNVAACLCGAHPGLTKRREAFGLYSA